MSRFLQLMVAAVLLAGPATLPCSADNFYAISDQGRVYSNQHADSAFGPDLAFPPIPGGEHIVGMDLDASRHFYMLTESGRVLFSSPDHGTLYSQLGPSAPVPLVGTGFGVEVSGRYEQDFPSLSRGGLVVTTTTGQNLYFDFLSQSWSVRNPLVRVPGLARFDLTGPTAAIGSLALFNYGIGQHSPYVGLDMSNGTISEVDPGSGSCYTIGPAMYFPAGGGDALPLPLAGATCAGFDAILYAGLNGSPAGYYGAIALNEPGSAHTRLYSMWAYWAGPNAGIFFQGPSDMMPNDGTEARFTAIAFSPAPGALMPMASAAVVLAVRRRRA